MCRLSISRAWCRTIGVGLLAAELLACTSWRVQGPTPAEAVRKRTPAVVRVTRTDQTRLVVHYPVLRGDSLVGQLFATGPQDTAASVSMPLRDVETVATRRFNVWKSIGLYFAASIVAAAVICLAGAECLEWQ